MVLHRCPLAEDEVGKLFHPRALTAFEERIKAYVQKNGISRAKVEVSVTYDLRTSGVDTVEVDLPLAAAYVRALRRLQEELDLRDDLSLMTLARNSEIFRYTRPEQDLDGEWETLQTVLQEALAAHTAMRTAEGQKTDADMREKLENVRRAAAEIAVISREDIVGYRDRLEGRIKTILADHDLCIDEQRILTECAIYADRLAIDEELARLDSHFSAFDEILRANEPAGRKLDFLMQEMNRETNTIGSKANNARIARLVVHMKSELEKVREQIQNIE